MSSLNRFRAQHQTNWDARAAANFIGGGAGCGLLLAAACGATLGQAYRVPAVLAVALVCAGLFGVWLEIGKPWRATNVFLHARTSWMTREALVAPLLLASAAWAVWTENMTWIWLAALSGLLFLYCQARILYAAKGIPAWREPHIVPLVFCTGLTEGFGLALAILGVQTWQAGTALPWWPAAALVPLLIVRLLAWRRYRRDLVSNAAPVEACQALDALEPGFVRIGHWGAALCVALTMAVPATPLAPVLAVCAGLSAALAGSVFKYCLITRAAYKQCYALPQLPVRGGYGLGES